MTEKRNVIFRFVAFLVVLFVLVGAQTSLWPSVFGALSPPSLWLTVIIYLSLQRDNNEGLISILLVSFAISVFTSLNAGFLVLAHICLFYSARFIKSRVFAFSGWYFGLACGLAVPLFTLFLLLLSHAIEESPKNDLDWLSLVVQTPLTAAAGVILFPLFLYVDTFFKDDVSESWRGV